MDDVCYLPIKSVYHVYMCRQYLHGIDNVHWCRECVETELQMIGYVKSIANNVWMMYSPADDMWIMYVMN